MANHGEALPLELLCCPRCSGPLRQAAGVDCTACGVEYPSVGGLPWLFPDPAAALGDWRARLHAFVAGLEQQSDRYRVALAGAGERASTRNRLKLLAGACSDHARRLRALLAPLADESTAAAPEIYRALGVALPVAQGLTSYYANLHRDWCWGEAENESCFRLVDEALGPDAPGRTLLPGVGAGRLAYDLHLRRQPELLLGADINPLLMLAARRLFAGEAVELYEFPVAPRGIDSHAILRRLRAPQPAPAGLHLLFADVTTGPFAPGAFDTVVTPWLIDILEEDCASFARRLNRWLRPGGRWINSGSLAFHGGDPASRYSLEELRVILAEAGFADVQCREEEVPYLSSPASRHARRETVVTFSAVKRQDASLPAPVRRAPQWLERVDLPVPLQPDLAGRQLELRVLAYVASLLDGQRSIRDIAQVLVDRRMVAAEEAEPMVQGFLRRMYQESRTGAGAVQP